MFGSSAEVLFYLFGLQYVTVALHRIVTTKTLLLITT